MGRVRLTRPFVLLALAALLAPRVEASRTGVRERNPPAAAELTTTNVAGLLAPLAPAATDDVDVVTAELPRFNLGDVVLVEREIEREGRFRLGPLEFLSPAPLRGPPSSYPETRVGGFELLPPFRVEASPKLSLWPRQACGTFSCEVTSDSRYDPWGLAAPPTYGNLALQAAEDVAEVASRPALRLVPPLAEEAAVGATAVAGRTLLGRALGPVAFITNFFANDASAPEAPKVSEPMVAPLPGVSPYSGQMLSALARGVEDSQYQQLLRLHNAFLQNEGQGASVPSAPKSARASVKRATPKPVRIKRGATGGPTAGKRFSDADRRAQLEEEPTQTCVYCLMPGTGTHLDHKVAKARDGNTDAENRQWACPHCNTSKGAREVPQTPPPGYSGPWPPSHWDEDK